MATVTGGARVGDYFALLKPRVMSLVVFTGVAGLALAPGHIDIATALMSVVANVRSMRPPASAAPIMTKPNSPPRTPSIGMDSHKRPSAMA